MAEENEYNNTRKTNQRYVKKRNGRIYANPFLNFLVDFRREMQGKVISQSQLTRIGGQRWREMSQEQRLPYIELAQRARKENNSGNKVVKKTKPVRKSGKKGEKKESEKGRRRKSKEADGDKKTKKCVYCGSLYDALGGMSMTSRSCTTVTSIGSNR